MGNINKKQVLNNIDLSYLNPYLDRVCGDFYNPKRLISYHKPFNLVQSSRSSGKSTSIAMLVILVYLLKGNTFYYMRRTDDETTRAARDFFLDAVQIIKDKLPELGLEDVVYDGGKFYITYKKDEEIVRDRLGTTMPLSMVYKRKSVNDPNATLIIFDEFVAVSENDYLGSKNTGSNLTEEYDRITNFYTTVDRGIGASYRNNTVIICLGNSTTLYNPLFIGLDATKYIVSNDAHFISPKRCLWVIERFSSVKATENIESSFGYLMSNEKQSMYHNDTNEFTSRYILSEKPKGCSCIANIIMQKKKYGIYFSDYKSLWYIADGDEACNQTYTLDVDSHEATGDKELCFALNDFYLSPQLKRYYSGGRLFFKNYRIQKVILAYLKIV